MVEAIVNAATFLNIAGPMVHVHIPAETVTTSVVGTRIMPPFPTNWEVARGFANEIMTTGILLI